MKITAPIVSRHRMQVSSNATTTIECGTPEAEGWIVMKAIDGDAARTLVGRTNIAYGRKW
ncbi:hypothetical protein E4U17_001117 [Claviceps sp. LM77 group G4]|nr:hypothetical protein E4U17_001117 [Claviceps sp. LM77 group G4]KAG6069737.1 hypothetical protein E4U16_007467 [Claviceps sp. LM84 group G4]KAG6079721.1 hypothetical protein E4U33_008206 [Claviceps sp. LM78 group G4]